MNVRPRQRLVRLAERTGRDLLVDEGDHEKREARPHHDPAERRVNEEHGEHEDGCERRVEKRDQGARGQERAQGLEIAQNLIVARGAVEGRARGRRQDRRAELHLHLDRRAHHDVAALLVEKGLHDHSADYHHGKHDERVDRARGQDAVRYLEQIDRDGEDEDVDDHGEGHHHNEVAAHPRDRTAIGGAKVLRTQAAVEAGVASTAAATATTRGGWGIGGTRRSRRACGHRPRIVIDHGSEAGRVRSGLGFGGSGLRRALRHGPCLVA